MTNRGMQIGNASIGLSGRNYDAFVSSQRSYQNDSDWAAKLQEKYWRAKQKFLAKVERREDACVVMSDAKLDAKLQIYRSIERSCARLTNILEEYQNSLFVFANEENALGILLKECGKHDTTKAGKILSITGKSLTQSSHQRIRLYMPLLRLHQEMETFHSYAVEDTTTTVDKLESKRAQYRASLLWMKDISEKLDPDTYKQLEKFRKVQSKVRDDKKVFDSTQMDVVQKIDLLMASRCNLMNQILAPYQSILHETFEKNCSNFKSVEDAIKQEDFFEYEFKSLKQLNPLRLDENVKPESSSSEKEEVKPQVEERQTDLLIDEESELSDDNNNTRQHKKESNLKLISDEFGQVRDDGLFDAYLDSKTQKDILGEPIEESSDITIDLLEDIFGKKESKSDGLKEPKSSQDKASPREAAADNKEILQDQIRAVRADLNANLLNMFDDEQQVASLLSLTESNMRKIAPKVGTLDKTTNKRSKKSKDSYELLGDDFLMQGDGNIEKEPEFDPMKATTSKISISGQNTVAKSACDLDLLGEAEEAQTKKDKTAILDLLGDLEDIDNNSCFKSLQGLQI